MKLVNRTAVAMAVAQLAWVAQASYAQQTTPTESLNTVVVTGQRAALQSAQKIKQNADEVIDSIVAEDIGKLPDRSITEVLQRIVGVSISRQSGDERFSVEGSGVNIRGLSYVRSELNGREAFAANGGRSLSWSDIPPELMAGVDVYKNPSAEQIEGGISGLVNLRTALPFDFKGQRLALSTESTYGTLRKGKPDVSVSGLYSNRFVTALGEFGALIDIASSDSSTRTDTFQFEPFYPRTDVVPGKTVWIPKGAQWRTYEYDRKRQGAYGALQWRGEKVRSHLTVFHSRYRDNSLEQSVFSSASPYDLLVSSDATYDAKGALLTGTISDTKNGGIPFNNAAGFSKGSSNTTDLAWNLQWKVNASLTLTSDLQRTKSKADAFSSAVGLGMLMPSQKLDYRGDLPRIEFNDAQRAFLANPANYYWGTTMEHLHRNTGELKAWKGDLRWNFDHPVLRDIRAGVRLTDREALTVNSDPAYNWAAVTLPWQLGWKLGELAYLSNPRFKSPYVVNPFSNFFNGKESVPSVVFPAPVVASNYPASYQELHSYHAILCAEKAAAQGWGSCDAWKAATFGGDNPAGTNSQHERTRAFYTQLRFGLDDLPFPVDGNIGLRYVQTRSTAGGYTVFRPTVNIPAGYNTTGVAIPNIPAYQQRSDVANSYDNLLPSLNLRMQASDKLQFRLAFGSSMSRPEFSQQQAYTTLSQNVDSSSNDTTKVINVIKVDRVGTAAGNPLLKPITSNQVDLTGEWYFAPSGSLTFAYFDKRLKDVVVDQTIGVSLPDVNGVKQQFLVTSPINGARGTARGAEIAYQQYFDNVPDWLKGIGLQANYTYVDSKRKLYNGVFTPYCSGSSGGADNLNLNFNGCDVDGRTFGNLPLPQLSRNTFNIAILFDRGPWSARIAYNWRDKYFLSTNTNGTRGGDGTDSNPASATFGKHNVAWGIPLWADAYGQLDAGVSYKFSDNFKLDLQAQNLSDARYQQFMHHGIGDKKRAVFASGPRYSVRASYSF